jgi:hypothetical protein
VFVSVHSVRKRSTIRRAGEIIDTRMLERITCPLCLMIEFFSSSVSLAAFY